MCFKGWEARGEEVAGGWGDEGVKKKKKKKKDTHKAGGTFKKVLLQPLESYLQAVFCMILSSTYRSGGYMWKKKLDRGKYTCMSPTGVFFGVFWGESSDGGRKCEKYVSYCTFNDAYIPYLYTRKDRM